MTKAGVVLRLVASSYFHSASGGVVIRVISLVVLYLILCQSSVGRTVRDVGSVPTELSSSVVGPPALCVAAHRCGMISLAVNNNGTFGTGHTMIPHADCFTGEFVPSCEYPRGSEGSYLSVGALWVGGVIDGDTLVSCGADGWNGTGEFFPDESPFGDMIYRSTLDSTASDHRIAVSEEDYIAVYTDTYIEEVARDYFGRPHMPLGIEVTQSSYAWSCQPAEDFVLINFQIKNISSNSIGDLYLGVFVDADICIDCRGTYGFGDDVSGFVGSIPLAYGSTVVDDTVQMGWSADDNGDFNRYPRMSSVTGALMLNPHPGETGFSFNWWVSNGHSSLDYGPRERSGVGAWQEEFRDFGTGGWGTPEGDGNKYYMLRNGEIDHDQIFTSTIWDRDTLWQEQGGSHFYWLTLDVSDGYDTRYLMSYGPYESLYPGETLTLTLAYVAGTKLHVDGSNGELYLPLSPDTYFANLDFSDFFLNAKWASWVYDNPGVDTDGDGFAGKQIMVGSHSLYVEGDGVPDFSAPTAPPPPVFWLEPGVRSIRVRWNGLQSETTTDIFSQVNDFEGYRVYLSSTTVPTSFSVIASYDLENYSKLVWNSESSEWENSLYPFAIGQLRCLYGSSCEDTTFDPLAYTRSAPYLHPQFPDSLFYFRPVGNNVSDLGVGVSIRKVCPDQPYPSSLDTAQVSPDELTADGYLKYFEYEIIVESLLPDRCYSIAVTAFDFGWPALGTQSLESSCGSVSKEACPLLHCCQGAERGNANGDSDETVDIVDIAYLVDYLFGLPLGQPPTCLEEANTNGDVEEAVNISDITYLIDYLFGIPLGPAPPPCP